MATISQETAKELLNRIDRLEARVQELEGKPRNALEAMRMVIMGPPGAGMTPQTARAP